MIPRGFRNRNPGNIRVGNAWHGELEWGLRTDEQKREKTFEVYTHATYGIRSIAKLMKNYHKHYGLNTVLGLISRYAPDIENNTIRYAAHVASILGVSITDPIDVTDPIIMRQLVHGIIVHECGSNPYTYEFEDGLKLA